LSNTKISFLCPKSATIIECLYLHSAKHRDGNLGKSQWTISQEEEAGSFKNTCEKNWRDGRSGWGIHTVGNKIAYLGYDREVGKVFLAKYDNHAEGEWHGYPCNYRINNQVPPQEILTDWVAEGILKLSKVRKITRGQRCAI
jgi:hypothetical protein